MSMISAQPIAPASAGPASARPASVGPAPVDPTSVHATRSHRTRLRLTRRGRVVVTAVAAIPVIVGAVMFALNGGPAVASGNGAASSFSHVTVMSGESLWQIAETIAPTADPRDVVSAIIGLNQLPSALVVPGQSLAIPTQYEH